MQYGGRFDGHLGVGLRTSPISRAAMDRFRGREFLLVVGSILYPHLKRRRIPPADGFCAEKKHVKGIRTRNEKPENLSRLFSTV